jgi:hypothetical protein
MQEDDEILGDGEAEPAIVIGFNKGERQIDTGRNTSGRPEVAVVDVNRIALHMYGWKLRCEIVDGCPVSNGATSIE